MLTYQSVNPITSSCAQMRCRYTTAVVSRSYNSHGVSGEAPHRATLVAHLVKSSCKRTRFTRDVKSVHASAAFTGAVSGEHQPTTTTNTTSTNTPNLHRVASTATSAFPVFVLGAAFLGLYNPSAFTWFRPGFMAPALGITMLGMGLTLTFADFRRVLASPRRIFLGFMLQYTIMPFMAYMVSRYFGIPVDFAVGLCLVGSCPGGTASNVVTYLARADVPLSVAMTTASTLAAVVATPLLTKILLGTIVPVDAVGLLSSTVQVVLLPVMLGAALNQAFPKQVESLAPLAALSAVLLIAFICGSVIAQNAAAVLSAGPQLLGAVVTLHAGGFLLGYTLAKALGLPERASRTTSIEVGMQNSALGALLATQHFVGNPLAAVPCAISACTHSVLGSLLASYWRGIPTEGEKDTSSISPPKDDKHVFETKDSNQNLVSVPSDVDDRKEDVRKWIEDWRRRTDGGVEVNTAVTGLTTQEEAAMYSPEQLAFLERKRKYAMEQNNRANRAL